MSGLELTGTYKATPPTLTDGVDSQIMLDAIGSARTTLATQIAGEDLVADVMKVEQRFNYLNITTNTTTVVKTGAGYLQQFTVNNPGKFTVADLAITVYDNTAASGTLIGTWTMPVVATAQAIPPITLNVAFNTGLTIVTSGPTVAANLTVTYR